MRSCVLYSWHYAKQEMAVKEIINIPVALSLRIFLKHHHWYGFGVTTFAATSTRIMPPTLDQPDLTSSRKAQIVAQFQQLLDSHLNDFVAGRVTRLYELQEMADQLRLHPVHLSQTIKQVTGHHACYFYEQRILVEAKKLLADTSLSITEVAHRLDYDASNFTKFFKRFTQMTPSVYRRSIAQPNA